MKSLLLVVLLAIVHTALAKGAKKADDKVKIAVYYEALCQDSKDFITEQLAPVWKNLRGSIKVKLVPYGKATHDLVKGNFEFSCHHGPDECMGNKVQACILKDREMSDPDKLDAIVCLMGQAHPDKALDKCLKEGTAERAGVCARGARGATLLAALGDKTDALMKPLSFVPTVVINEHYDQATQNDALSNLTAVVCRVAVNKPAACP